MTDFNLEALNSLYPDTKTNDPSPWVRSETSTAPVTNDIHQQEIPPQDGMVYKVMSGQCDWDPWYPWEPVPNYEQDDTVIKTTITTTTTSPDFEIKEAKPDKDDLIDYFMDWFKDVTDFEYRIDGCLKDHGYLTEGDVCQAVGVTSSCKNPFMYYYGDRESYRKDITDLLDREFDCLSVEIEDGLVVKDSLHYKRVKALYEAIQEFYEEYENADLE